MILAKMILWMLLFQNDIALFQLNRYQQDRYFSHLRKMRYTWQYLGMLILVISLWIPKELALILCLIVLFLIISHVHRIRFKLTMRIKRMELCLCMMGLLICLIDHLLGHQFVFFILILIHEYTFILPMMLMQPLENEIRLTYQKKASMKLNNYSGLKVGITGSYGKTSVKNICDTLLSLKYHPLSTPLSYNNAMGISKTVLKDLTEYHDVFLCEMGADHLHEIEDLAKMVQPSIGILTSVGPQHLATFKAIPNVLYEKMQLIEALPAHGIGILNYDNDFIRQHAHTSLARIITVGIDHDADIKANHLVCNALGSHFDVEIQGKTVHFETILLGKHQIINILLAIALADSLGLDSSLIQVGVKTLQPTAHRMELKPFFEATLIDNAYNSNPQSAQCSLETLDMMPGRHICITPGFIDLGEFHDSYSFEFGKQLAQVCDMILLVGKCEQIQKGLQAVNYDENQILTVPTMKQALEVVSALLQENDVILIENDIPEGLKS